MCNFVPVRNWLIGLALMLSLALSSAWFAYVWFGTYVGAISFTFAAAWCVAAGVFVGYAGAAAARFCTCVTAVKACTVACSQIVPAIYAALIPLFVLGATCVAGAFGINFAQVFPLLFWTSGALGVATVYVGYLASVLGSCQSPGR